MNNTRRPPAARPSSRYRFLAVLVTLVIIVSGLLALRWIPVDLSSLQAPAHLLLRVSAPGVGAPVIEETFTRPLEQALTGLADATSMESVTTSNGVVVDVTLKHPRALAAAQQEASARVASLKPGWPAAVEPPGVTVSDASSLVAEFYVTSRERDALALRDWTQEGFARKLRELPGVSSVEMEGGAAREILVTPDQRRLAGYGLSFGDLLQAIRASTTADAPVRRPASMRRGRHAVMQSGGAAAVSAMPVMLPSGESISLSEIATITTGEIAQPGSFRFEGQEAVKVSVYKLPQAAAAEVSKQIKAHDDWMRVNRVVPDDISIHPLRSQFTEARHAFRRIALALVAGFVLALFTGRMLLGNGRRGVLLGVVMLVSVQSAFLWMALLKISLDAITLGGLALGTGFFGGSAILLFGRAHQPADVRAILKNPLIIAALTLLTALLPLLFVNGGIDEVFRRLIPVWLLAGSVSVLFSLLLVSAFDRGNPAQVADADTFTEKFPAHQPRRWRRDTTMLFLTAFILTALLLAALVIKRNEVSPLNDAGAITLSLQGEDRERLAVFAEDLARRLRVMPSLHNVSHGAQPSQEEFQLRMDESRARERGIEITEAGRALAIALTGISAGSFSDAEHRYDIRLRLPPDESANDIAMGRVLLLGELEHRPAVYLRDVARIEHASAPARLLRRNGIPAVEIMASPAQGASPGQAWDGIRKVLDDYPLPAGYRLTYPDHGDFPETYRDWNPALFGMALLFVFVALAAWQRSLRVAFAVAVVAAIVVAGTGLVLWLLDVSLSPLVELGGLILLGIVAGQAATGAAALAQSGGQDAQESMKPPYSPGHPFHMLMIQTLVAVAGMTPLLFISDAASRLHPVMLTLETGLLLSLPVILFVVPNYMCSVFDPGRKAKNKT